MKVISHHLNTINAGKLSFSDWTINSSTTLSLIAGYHVLNNGSLTSLLNSGRNYLRNSLSTITPDITKFAEEIETEALNQADQFIDHATLLIENFR